HLARRGINAPQDSWLHLRKPDAPRWVRRHRIDRRLAVGQRHQRQFARRGIESAHRAAVQIAKPDAAGSDCQAEWIGARGARWDGYLPRLYRARGWVEPPDAPAEQRKPELAVGVKREILWRHARRNRRIKRKDLECLGGRVEAPNIVGRLLGEPDVALLVYRRRHDIVFATGRRPLRHLACLRIDPGKLIGHHLANPDVSLRVNRWLHQPSA